MPIQNLPTRYIDETAVAERQLDVPDADFEGGMNPNASCAGVIGINTADFHETEPSWPGAEGTIESSHIGLETILDADKLVDVDLNAEFDPAYFIQAAAPVAPGGVLGVDSVTGRDVINQSEKTVPIGAWIWGVIAPAP